MIRLIEKEFGKIFDNFLYDFFKMHFKNIYSKDEDHSDEYDKFLNEFKETVFIAGGCIPNRLKNKKINDFDIFIKTDEIKQFIISYVLSIIQSYAIDTSELFWSNKFGCFYTKKDKQYYDDVKDFDCYDSLAKANKKYEIVFFKEYEVLDEFDFIMDNPPRKIIISKNAITIVLNSNTFQFIICDIFDENTIVNNFDFIHTTNYFDPATQKIHLNNDAMLSIATNELKYVGSNHPISSLIRLRKFEKDGWNINKFDILRICNDISKISLTDKESYLREITGISGINYKEIFEVLNEYKFSEVIDFKEFIEKLESIHLNK
jgi:hypothetical protein